jgi:hypothetical protein
MAVYRFPAISTVVLVGSAYGFTVTGDGQARQLFRIIYQNQFEAEAAHEAMVRVLGSAVELETLQL